MSYTFLREGISPEEISSLAASIQNYWSCPVIDHGVLKETTALGRVIFWFRSLVQDIVTDREYVRFVALHVSIVAKKALPDESLLVRPLQKLQDRVLSSYTGASIPEKVLQIVEKTLFKSHSSKEYLWPGGGFLKLALEVGREVVPSWNPFHAIFKTYNFQEEVPIDLSLQAVPLLGEITKAQRKALAKRERERVDAECQKEKKVKSLGKAFRVLQYQLTDEVLSMWDERSFLDFLYTTRCKLDDEVLERILLKTSSESLRPYDSELFFKLLGKKDPDGREKWKKFSAQFLIFCDQLESDSWKERDEKISWIGEHIGECHLEKRGAHVLFNKLSKEELESLSNPLKVVRLLDEEDGEKVDWLTFDFNPGEELRNTASHSKLLTFLIAKKLSPYSNFSSDEVLSIIQALLPQYQEKLSSENVQTILQKLSKEQLVSISFYGSFIEKAFAIPDVKPEKLLPLFEKYLLLDHSENEAYNLLKQRPEGEKLMWKSFLLILLQRPQFGDFNHIIRALTGRKSYFT